MVLVFLAKGFMNRLAREPRTFAGGQTGWSQALKQFSFLTCVYFEVSKWTSQLSSGGGYGKLAFASRLGMRDFMPVQIY